MTRDDFRKMLETTYGHRPYYLRHEPETRQIRGEVPGSMSNSDAAGKGVKPFYIGRQAAYPTPELIELAVSRFRESN